MKDYNLTIKNFKSDWGNLYILGELTNEVIEETTEFFKNYPLRGFDAIHLATALVAKRKLNTSLNFLCSDRNLLTAAKEEGLKAVNPSDKEKK